MRTQEGTWIDGSMGVCRKHLVFFGGFAFPGEMMWFKVETAVVNVPAMFVCGHIFTIAIMVFYKAPYDGKQALRQ